MPNLDGVKPMDISPEVAQTLADARTAGEALQVRFELFKSLCRLLGHDSPSGRAERADGLTTLMYLCEPDEHLVSAGGFGDATSAVWRAADVILAYARGDSRLTLGALAPFIVPVTFGWELALAGPREADERRRRVFGQQ